jgi:co-chaperonin GroES (HSP10)
MEQKNSFPAQALNYNVILKEVETENITDGGLDISGISDKNEKFRKGYVLSVGESCPKRNVEIFGIKIPFWKVQRLQICQEVIYDNYKSSDITIEGVLYKQVLYADLLLVL